MRLLSMRLLRNVVARYSRGAAALAVAGGYAAVVVGVAVFVIVASSLKPASIAGVWLLLVTVPSSLVVQLIPAQGNAFTLLLTLGGLVQAWLLWVVLRGERLHAPPFGEHGPGDGYGAVADGESGGGG